MTLLAAADPDLILQQLSTDLMSPYCPGRTIASCPSPQARQLEDHILAEAQAGKSREQIETELVQRFGEEIVGYRPQPLVLYGSALVGILALGAVVLMGRRWARGSRMATGTAAIAGAGAGAGAGALAVAGAPAAPTQAELDRLEDALDEVDEL